MALHCPTTLLVSRHGDAVYDHPHVLSDDGGWLSAKGREQVLSLAEKERPRRVAAIYTSTMERAIESGGLAADILGVRHSALDGLQELGVGMLAGKPHDCPDLKAVFAAWLAGDLDARIPGAESGQDVIGRYEGALQEIADQHRGETVLVFSHGGVMSFVLPRISGNLRNGLARQKYLPNCVPAEVVAGDDGWQVVSWPGTADVSDV